MELFFRIYDTCFGVIYSEGVIPIHYYFITQTLIGSDVSLNLQEFLEENMSKLKVIVFLDSAKYPRIPQETKHE